MIHADAKRVSVCICIMKLGPFQLLNYDFQESARADLQNPLIFWDEGLFIDLCIVKADCALFKQAARLVAAFYQTALSQYGNDILKTIRFVFG